MKPDAGAIIPELSTVGECESNGTIERSILPIGGLVRTLKDAVEAADGIKLDQNHPILPWLVMYASTMLTRGEVGVDGNTAYERNGKQFKRALPPVR